MRVLTPARLAARRPALRAFAYRLRLAMTTSNRSVAEVATGADIDPRSVYAYLEASREPGVSVLFDLARYLRVSPEWLWTGVHPEVALRTALAHFAMRELRPSGELCWCDGPVLHPSTHVHEPTCVEARAALGAIT